jgi:hypothetical protein
LALKGERVAAELASARPLLERSGAGAMAVHELAGPPGVEPTWVAVVERAARRSRREEGRRR